MCSGNLYPGCQVEENTSTSCPGMLLRSLWNTSLLASPAPWAWMISEAPAPIRIPPANKVAANILVFIVDTPSQKINGAARRAAPLFQQCMRSERHDHRFRIIMETVADLGDVAIARPCEV